MACGFVEDHGPWWVLRVAGEPMYIEASEEEGRGQINGGGRSRMVDHKRCWLSHIQRVSV